MAHRTKYLSIVLYLLAMRLFVGCSSYNCTKEESFYVRGNCEMCKERIENALRKQAGVCKAEWNVKTKMLTCLYDSTITNPEDIKALCAKVGHDTEEFKTPEEVHNALPECCQRKAKPM